jgi:putative DNA primase/helicase
MSNTCEVKEMSNWSMDWYHKNISKHGKVTVELVPNLLCEHLKKIYDLLFIGGVIYLYENGCYKEVSRQYMQRIIKKYCNERVTSRQLTEVLELWTIDQENDYELLNNSDHLTNVKNCMILWDYFGNYNVIEHNKNFYSSIQLDVKYDKDATCEKWIKFLTEVLTPGQIILLQEIMGYFLITNTRAKRFFTFYGVKDCGKSIILYVLESILGKKNCSSVELHKICNTEDRFVTSDLFGTIANICGDLPAKSLDDTGTLKMLTGTDTIRAERKGQQAFNFKYKGKLIFSCNTLPKNYNDRTESFYQRLILVPFKISIPVERQIKNLDLLLENEKNGILNWMMEGLSRLLKNELTFSLNNENKKEINNYKVSNNNIAQFIIESCKLDSNEKIHSAVIYDEYKKYCNDGGFKAVSIQNFKQELESQGCRSSTNIIIDGKRVRGFYGIRMLKLNESNEEYELIEREGLKD